MASYCYVVKWLKIAHEQSIFYNSGKPEKHEIGLCCIAFSLMKLRYERQAPQPHSALVFKGLKIYRLDLKTVH